MLLALGAISLPSTPFHPRRSTRICRTLMNCDALAFPPLLSFSSFSSGFAFPFPFPFSADLPFGAICLIWGFGRCLEVGIRTVVVCANGGVEQGSPTTGKKNPIGKQPRLSHVDVTPILNKPRVTFSSFV
jgi:hypothetical protein